MTNNRARLGPRTEAARTVSIRKVSAPFYVAGIGWLRRDLSAPSPAKAWRLIAKAAGKTAAQKVKP